MLALTIYRCRGRFALIVPELPGDAMCAFFCRLTLFVECSVRSLVFFTTLREIEKGSGSCDLLSKYSGTSQSFILHCFSCLCSLIIIVVFSGVCKNKYSKCHSMELSGFLFSRGGVFGIIKIMGVLVLFMWRLN